MEGELAECRAAAEEADAHVAQLQALRAIEAAARRAASAEHQARPLPWRGSHACMMGTDALCCVLIAIFTAS